MTPLNRYTPYQICTDMRPLRKKAKDSAERQEKRRITAQQSSQRYRENKKSELEKQEGELTRQKNELALLKTQNNQLNHSLKELEIHKTQNQELVHFLNERDQLNAFLKERVSLLETKTVDDQDVIDRLHADVQALDERVYALQDRIYFLEDQQEACHSTIRRLNHATYRIPDLEQQIFDLNQINAENVAYIQFLHSQAK